MKNCRLLIGSPSTHASMASARRSFRAVQRTVWAEARGIRFNAGFGLARILWDGMDYGNCMLLCWPGKGESRPDRRFAGIRETGQLGGRALAACPRTHTKASGGKPCRRGLTDRLQIKVGGGLASRVSHPAALPMPDLIELGQQAGQLAARHHVHAADEPSPSDSDGPPVAR